MPLWAWVGLFRFSQVLPSFGELSMPDVIRKQLRRSDGLDMHGLLWSNLVGVRAWLARGYFIPGGASQRGGGQAPMFQCRTLSDPVRGQA